MKLDDLRIKVDKIDKKILLLLHKRFQLAQEIKQLKDKSGFPVEDKIREKKLIENLIYKGSELNISGSFIKKIISIIIEESKKIQYE